MWGFAICALLLATSCASWRLEPGPYIKLPGANGCRTYNNGAATKASYDAQENLLYVIGYRQDIIHIVDLSDPNDPRVLDTKPFNRIVDGLPDTVKVCRFGNREFLAVSFEAPLQTERGHVHFYGLLTAATATSDLVDIRLPVPLDSYDPKGLAWTSDCLEMLVASEGDPHEINGVFEDPAADVEVLSLGFGDTIDRTPLAFTESALEQADIRQVFRTCTVGSPGHASSRVQDLEPKTVHIDKNNNGYIIFQENNAIGKLDMNHGASPRTVQFHSLGYKDRSVHSFDASDQDGGINLATRKLRAFYQPNDVTSFEILGKVYLATADQGAIRRYTLGTCQFDESVNGRTWIASNSFADGMTSAEESLLTAQLNDNAQLGRLRLSNLKKSTDGWDSLFGGYDFVCTFGGRGFSIWDPSLWNAPGRVEPPVFTSGDQFERYFVSANPRHQSMFNTGVGPENTAQSSTYDRESPELGPAPSAISSAEINGTALIAIANGRVGGIYLYSAYSEFTAGLQVTFEQYLRRGNPGMSWSGAYGPADCTMAYNSTLDAYAENDIGEAAVGEPGVTDLIYIEDNGSRMFVAISDVAGSLSFYRVVQT